MDYSKLIRQVRNELLVTQEELAEMLGVTFATVNRWENGHHEPNMKQKRAIRDFCKRKRIKLEGGQNGVK